MTSEESALKLCIDLGKGEKVDASRHRGAKDLVEA